jgi:uncharacterized heparinase superfamily protein
MMQTLGRYWHTLKYLKLIQIYGRLRYRFSRPQPDLRSAPELAKPQRVWTLVQGRQPSMTGPKEFVFLGESGHLDQLGWDGPQRSKLWRYNQHYFDDLNAVGADERKDWHTSLLQEWVNANAPACGNGWEPYPVSLRIVNWLKWSACGYALPVDCVQSLAVQARWLSKRLEWHLLGNHLFVNAKALVMVGLAFSGKEAEKWLQGGLKIIQSELPEQVLPDGGNFELSPMYHAIFLEDLLDLIQASMVWPGRIPTDVVDGWRETASKMLRWLNGMSHPDGEISLFNDSAIGVAPSPSSLAQAAKLLGISTSAQIAGAGPSLDHFVESGYVRVELGDALALLDVARVGPDYLPGHAHADTLSFEMSVHGQRVIVNGGTSRYGLGPEREYERSTAAHSTVEVDGQNSSEVWSGFRVARRAYPFALDVQQTGGGIQVSCSHDGYRRLDGAPIHRRTWEFTDKSAKIRDCVTGQVGQAVARFVIHPDVEVKTVARDEWVLLLPTGSSVKVKLGAGSGVLVTNQYAARFGCSVKTSCLVVTLQAGVSEILLTW